MQGTERTSLPGKGTLPMSEASISVIVPVHDGGQAFCNCLLALTTTEPAPGEIIVVTDGDTDHSRAIAETFGVRVLNTSTRVGPAQARNLGACAAQGDILFFLDADVLVPPDIIAQVRVLFGQEPDLTAVFGSYDDEPAEGNFVSQYKNLFHHYVHQTSRQEASTFWAGCGAIYRNAFLSVGGFDANYDRPAIEDIELGYRLTRAGYRIRLGKTLQVKHLKRWTALSLLKTDFFCRALPWTDLILRDHRFINDLNLQYNSRISVALTLGFLCAILGAWWWNEFLPAAAVALLLLLALNLPLYHFFLHQRGLWFTLRAIPWHWLYYFYSGLAFALGVIHYLVENKPGPACRMAENGCGIKLEAEGNCAEPKYRVCVS